MTQASEDFELHVASWSQLIKLAGEGLRDGDKIPNIFALERRDLYRAGGIVPQQLYLFPRKKTV